MRRNKQTVVTAFAERSGYQSASQSALIELSADDIVYLQVCKDSGVHSHARAMVDSRYWPVGVTQVAR